MPGKILESKFFVESWGNCQKNFKKCWKKIVEIYGYCVETYLENLK